MLSYNLKLSLKSIFKYRFLSAMMVLAIALGIGLSMTIVTLYRMASNDPIPEKSNQLHVVRLDSWNPLEAFREPDIAPFQLTYMDAMMLRHSDIPVRQAAMFKTGSVLIPDEKNLLPFQVVARATDRDFFSLFNVPFLYGSVWSESADEQGALVTVISKQINEKVFAGENSVGRVINTGKYSLKVVGVLDQWQPTFKYYDVNNGPFDDVEDLYLPFALTPSLQLPSWGNTNGWKDQVIDTYEDRLNSELIWIQYWAELTTQDDVSDYHSFLDGYAQEQKKLGRFERPLNNQVTPLMTWLTEQNVVGNETQVLLALAFMFLVVCLLNVMGLNLAKFSGKFTEVSIRRALGAKRSTLFMQQLIESSMVGLIGGFFGVILALIGLAGVSMLIPAISRLASMDAWMLSGSVLLSVFCTVLAGLYPTWRVCQIQPANYLQTQ